MLPLSGVRVLAVEQYGAGPIGTLYLASLGAEIIKIENPSGGDISRDVGPHFISDFESDRASLFFQGLNHDKRSVTLDLSCAAGQAVFKRLVATADAVASNLRGDVAERLGLTYAQLAATNPRIVCAHLTAYGRNGPRKSWPGYDYLMQAETGYFALTGEPDSPPSRFGLSVVDFMTGLALAYALTAGIVDVKMRGVGRDLDVNLFDVALFNLNYVATWFLNAGDAPVRAPRSAHLSLTPCQLCKTGDGFIYVMCNKEKFWLALADAVGHPEWKRDARYANYTERLRNRDALTRDLDAALSVRSTSEWLTIFAGKVPAAPVLEVSEALNSEYVAQQGKLMDVPLRDGRSIRLIRPPIQTQEPPRQSSAAPGLGEHTDSLMREIGYDEATIAQLHSEGVI